MVVDHSWSGHASAGTASDIIIDGNLNAKKYTELLSEVKETMEQLYGKLDKLLFQQDNAPCHNAKKAMKWFK